MNGEYHCGRPTPPLPLSPSLETTVVFLAQLPKRERERERGSAKWPRAPVSATMPVPWRREASCGADAATAATVFDRLPKMLPAPSLHPPSLNVVTVVLTRCATVRVQLIALSECSSFLHLNVNDACVNSRRGETDRSKEREKEMSWIIFAAGPDTAVPQQQRRTDVVI